MVTINYKESETEEGLKSKIQALLDSGLTSDEIKAILLTHRGYVVWYITA